MITEILPEMLAQVRKHFERDGINETKLIAQCKTFKDKYIIKNRIPTARDRKKIEKIYRQITPYRIMVEELSVIKGYLDHLPILRDIYEAMQAVYYIINKHYYSTVGNPNLGQRLRAIVDEYRKNQDIAPSTLPGFVDVSKEEAPVIPIPNNIESCTASCESTPAISGHDDSKKDVKTTEAAAPTAYPADFSHMRSFTPNKAFDMSALYTFLVDEGVVDNIDERLFADCISHAYVYELWEIAGRRRYPSRYYEFMSTEYRVNLALGQRFTWQIPEQRRKRASSVSLFYEVSTCDIYIRSKIIDHGIPFKDLFGLSLGVKLQTM